MLNLDPMEAIYSFVERAYVRLQAGDVLVRCMDEDNSAPLQKWVEGLLLAGPVSLDALREIKAEVTETKARSMKEVRQISTNFEGQLEEYGFRLGDLKKTAWLVKLTPLKFSRILQAQGVSDGQTQRNCLQQLNEAHKQLNQVYIQLGLLEEIEGYLEDWLWGLVYQSAHQVQAEAYRTLRA